MPVYTYMPLKYGSYVFTSPVELGYSMDEVARDQRGRAYLQRYVLDVKSFILSDTLANLKTAISALETALASDAQNLIFYATDGTTATNVNVVSANTLSGVRCTLRPHQTASPTWLYVPNTPWEFQCKFEWLVELVAVANKDVDVNVLEFSESVQKGGGGEMFASVAGSPPIEGYAGRYRTVEHAPFTASQLGSVTYWHDPTDLLSKVPPPLWPEAVMGPAQITVAGPLERYGTSYRRYSVQYEYRFESPEAELEGAPTSWPS